MAAAGLLGPDLVPSLLPSDPIDGPAVDRVASRDSVIVVVVVIPRQLFSTIRRIP